MCCCFGLWHYSSTGVSEIIWGDYIEHFLDVDWCHLVDQFIYVYGQSAGHLDVQHSFTFNNVVKVSYHYLTSEEYNVCL